jgi:O-antigen/teichoic acid export membrane protein
MKRLLRLAAKPGVLTALAFGFSGAAFIAANLLLARELPKEQFALVSLLVSIITVAVVAAPLGVDGVVARKSSRMSPSLLRRVLLTSVVVALGVALYTRLQYSIDLPATAMVLVCICTGALATVIAAHFQAAHEFGRSLFYLRSPDFALFIAAIVAFALSARVALVPLVAMTLIYVAVAAVAWRDGLRLQDSAGPARIDLREAGAYLSVQLSANLLMQLERLLAAGLLGLQDLATLGVVLSVVGPPFRLLQLTAGYALQPRLRSEKSPAARKRLLMVECAQASAIVAAASLVLWFATPWLVQLLLRGKFSVPSDVLLATLVSATLKVFAGIARAAVTALADNRELFYIGIISWIGVAVSCAAAVAFAHFGLSGIIYSVASGWLVRVLASAYFVDKGLRRT